MELYQPKYSYFSSLQITDIVFDEGLVLATLFGQYKVNATSDYENCDFVCEFDVLGDLLLLAGECADSVLESLAARIKADYIESPTVIDVTALAGGPIEISQASIKVYRPHVQNETGEWIENTEEDCYCIAGVESGCFSQSAVAKEKRPQPRSGYAQSFDAHLALLQQSYRYYKNLLRQNFSKKAARRQAGLADEMLFRLAHLQHKIRE